MWVLMGPDHLEALRIGVEPPWLPKITSREAIESLVFGSRCSRDSCVNLCELSILGWQEDASAGELAA